MFYSVVWNVVSMFVSVNSQRGVEEVDMFLTCVST